MQARLNRLRGVWQSLGLRARLGGAFGIVLALALACGVVGLLALERVHTASADLANRWLPAIGHLNAARAAMLTAREWEVKHSTASDAGYREEYEEKLQAALKDRKAAMAAHAALPAVASEAPLVAAYDKAWGAYDQAWQKVVALGKADKSQDAHEISDGVAKMAADEAITAMDKLLAHGFAAAKAAGDAADEVYALARKALAIGLGAAFLAGVLLATLIVRSLVRQLGGEPREAAAVAGAVAAGDLAVPIRLRAGDDASLMAQLARMQQSLAGVVSTVRGSAQSLAAATGEIAQGNNDLSGRTERQASALQQTAASMAQLREAVNENADNARRADELARRAQSIAGEGGAAAERVMQTMRAINEGSRRVAEITSVIDGIAFQTNILALNAAVEAARAGEQGRGFAVVAGEVRSLAQRSQEAAREIKQLIDESVSRVEQGAGIADAAGGTMQQVVQAIGDVAGVIGQISQASASQSEGVRQVADAVTQMDEVTQQNAALVEQAAASAESLRDQATVLVQSVSVFRVGDEARA
jgi:methyl-accepting chemotaxis protein